MSFASPSIADGEEKNVGANRAYDENHPTVIAAATRLHKDVAILISLYIPADSIPEITFLSIHQLSKLIINQRSWYSNKQLSEIVDMSDQISLVKACIADLDAEPLEMKNDDSEEIPLWEQFLFLYRQYKNLLPLDKHNQLAGDFLEKQAHRGNTFLRPLRMSSKFLLEVRLALTHACLNPRIIELDILKRILLKASLRGQTELVRAVLAAKPNPEDRHTLLSATCPVTKRNALMMAIVNNHKAVISLLLGTLAHQELQHAKDINGYTAFMLSCMSDHIESVKLLLAAAPSNEAKLTLLFEKDNKGWHALMFAAECGHTKIISLLIQAAPSDDDSLSMLQAKNSLGWTADMLAEEYNHTQTMKVLRRTEKQLLAKHATALSDQNRTSNPHAPSITAPAAALFGEAGSTKQTDTTPPDGSGSLQPGSARPAP